MLLDLLTRVLYVLHAIAQLTFNAATSLEIERKLQVPSRQLLLQQAAELHFQHVAIRRKTEVNVKEAMIHRFQRQSKPKFRADLPLYLRKSRHGAERHSSKFRLAVF